jgi:hypothetical protein
VLDGSKLKLYSMGLAAENLTPGSKTLQVTPTEHMMFLDGEIKSQPTPMTVTGVDASGQSSQTTITMDNAIEATWLPWNSNQITAPNIRRGERVFLWRFADRSDKQGFLWTDSGMDRNLRKLETVTYAWNATQDESDNTQSPSNQYYLEVSAHRGTVTFQSSKANGEKTAYTLQLNAMAGTFTLADDLGQIVFMDAVNHVIHAINADKSEVTLSKQVITIQCQDTLNLTALKTLSIQTQALNVTAKDITINASNSITAQTNTATLQANSLALNAQTTTVSGITISNGQIQCGGINSTGPVTAPNIN